MEKSPEKVLPVGKKIGSIHCLPSPIGQELPHGLLTASHLPGGTRIREGKGVPHGVVAESSGCLLQLRTGTPAIPGCVHSGWSEQVRPEDVKWVKKVSNPFHREVVIAQGSKGNHAMEKDFLCQLPGPECIGAAESADSMTRRQSKLKGNSK